MAIKKVEKNIIIYQAKNGAIELRGDYTRETIWATQKQIADVFGVTVPTINEHLKNIFKTRELNESSVIRKFLITANDGKNYNTQFYNLDAVISVGYRVNSKTATEFRKWATKTLRSYIVDGFVVNKNRITKNYTHFLSVVESLNKLLPKESSINPKDAIELVSLFADTWLSLGAYDKELLPKGKLTKKKVVFTRDNISKDLANLRETLIKKGEASDIFGNERDFGSVSGIIGNVMQSFDGKELYSTIEEKAAHLLYFMVKNHPFVDGNKRSGAFAFVWFLKNAKILNIKKLTPSALTALTVLVAESDPKHKDKIIKLILNLL
ncbi:MAG: virulence protein RhuM/Fic/DOC family protein [bacterium]